MNQLNSVEMEIEGFQKVYDYTQYSHENNVNVIPEEAFKRLICDTFGTITNTMRETYGPYGSSVVIVDQNETTTTKDGYNVFSAMAFSHSYKRLVYLSIKKICERVNKNVGDGTTSCILLAEKIFNNLNKLDLGNSPDEKRGVLDALSFIEHNLQNIDCVQKDMDDKKIKPLSNDGLRSVINLASNYDEELVSTLVDAFKPEYDDDSHITNIRNIIVEAKVDASPETVATYNIDYLPGDYRVRVDMDVEFGLALNHPTDMRVYLYDHGFTSSDWSRFINDYDDRPAIILARGFNASFMDNEYVRYMHKLELAKKPVPIFLAIIKGEFVQNEIQDLGKLIKTKPITMNDTTIHHDEMPICTISVYNGNALCFYDVTKPSEYIDTLVKEMDKDLSKSLVKHKNYQDRIKALSLSTKDTLLTVTSSSSLESKLICDKIDDCVSIINSALINGIVPNMLVYGYHRINDIKNTDNEETDMTSLIDVADIIGKSIEELFHDIWSSKYGNNADTSFNEVSTKLYDIKDTQKHCDYSFNIISNKFVDRESLPTSSQYDLEVITAAISIVKYLFTSRAFIFDANLLRPVDDIGRYQRGL